MQQQPLLPTPSSEPPTTLQTWSLAFEVLKSQKKQLITLGLATVLGPYLLWVLWESHQSQQAVEALSQVQGPDYQAYLEPFYQFSLRYLLFGAGFLGLGTAGFLASIRVCVAYFRSETLSAQSALREGLKLSFPHGLIILMVCAFFSLERDFLGPFRIFTLIALMAAVLLVAEREKSWRCLKQALLFRYSSPAYGSAFSTAFVLVGLSALVFAAELSLGFISQAILEADRILGLKRHFWSTPLPGLPLTGPYLLAKISSGLGLAFMLALVAAFLVSLFYRVRPRISQLV